MEQLRPRGDLAEEGVDTLGVLVDDQDGVTAGIVLEVVAEIEVQPRGGAHPGHGVDPAIDVAPGVVVVDHVDAAGRRGVVVELGVVGPPPMVVGLDEQLQLVAGREIDLAAEDVLVALIEGALDAVRVGVIERALVVLLGDAEAHALGQVDRVLAADAEQLVAALALGGAGLEFGPRERQEAVRLVRGGIGHQPAGPQRSADEAIEVVAGIGVAAASDCPVQMVGEVLGDDVDRAGHALGAVEQRLRPLHHLDTLDHAGRQCVERRGAGIEAVVDPHTIHQPQHVGGTRAEERDAHIVEGAVLGGDVEAWHRGLQ